jgi:hypothetical protein
MTKKKTDRIMYYIIEIESNNQKELIKSDLSIIELILGNYGQIS